MLQIVVLTDRPAKDIVLARLAVTVAQSTGENGVITVVSCGHHNHVPLEFLGAAPDGSLLPHVLLPTLFSESGDAVSLKTVFMECERLAKTHEIAFQTASSENSLSSVFATLCRLEGLTIIGREAFCDAAFPSQLLRCDRVSLLVICQNLPAAWKRIVVAARDDDLRDDLLTCGRDWANRLSLPIATIELESPRRKSVFSTIRYWIQSLFRMKQDNTASDCLLAADVSVEDLLLVDHLPSIWRFHGQEYLLSIEDIVNGAECSVAIVPNS